jgi:hypothetical protein
MGFKKHAIKVVSCGTIDIKGLMTTGISVQAILQYCLRNLRGCNVGITERKGL